MKTSATASDAGARRTPPPKSRSLIGKREPASPISRLAFGGEGGQGTAFLDRFRSPLHQLSRCGQSNARRSERPDRGFDKDDGFKGKPLILKGLLPPIAVKKDDDWAMIRLECPVTDRTPIGGHEEPLAQARTDPDHPASGRPLQRWSVDRSTDFDDRVIRRSAGYPEGSSGVRLDGDAPHRPAPRGVDPKVGELYNEGLRIKRLIEGLRAANIPVSTDAVGFIAELR